jgi:SAM-dependent methyltransferase
VKGATVLDAACGTGYGSAMLLSAGAKSVIGVDISEDAVSSARTSFPSMVFQIADVQRLDLVNCIDTVVSFETIEHLSEPDAFLRCIVNSLRPSGSLLISTPIRSRGKLGDKPENPFHCREWDEAEFVSLLVKYFETVSVFYQFNFRKLWYPFSRTLSVTLSLLLRTRKTRQFLKFNVTRESELHASIWIHKEYVVVVCSGPKKGEGLMDPMVVA